VLRLSRFGRAERLTQCSSTVLRVFVTAQARAATQPDYAHVAWEHVRSQLTALLSGAPLTAGETADSDTHARSAADGTITHANGGVPTPHLP
jgi:hypothetical protein